MPKGGSEKHLFKQRAHHDKEFGIFSVISGTRNSETNYVNNNIQGYLKQHKTLKWLKRDFKVHIK